MRLQQRGGFVLGVIVGLLVGLSLALGVALYITKAPVPFVNKVPQRTAEQDQAEQARNRNWDPNAPLAGKPPKIPSPAGSAPADTAASAAPAATGTTTAATAASAAASGARTGAAAKDPAAILSGAPTPAPRGAEPFVFFVQAGAFTRAEEAEQQRAKLAMLGHTAKITEREQGGRTVYRVRMGPYETRGEAEGQQNKLQAASIESQLVRVERP